MAGKFVGKPADDDSLTATPQEAAQILRGQSAAAVGSSNQSVTLSFSEGVFVLQFGKQH
jgi:hypothetical protein